MDPAQAQRLEEIMRLQAELFAGLGAIPQPPAPRRPGDKGVTSPDTPGGIPPPDTAPRPRYHKGHFGPQHGLTPAQAWQAEQLLRQKRPFRGPHRQQKEAARVRGIIAAVKAGRVGNRHWGRSMLGKRGGLAMATHGRHILQAIASKGGEAKRDGRTKKLALAHWEHRGEPLPLTPRETGGHPVPSMEAWHAGRPFLLW